MIYLIHFDQPYEHARHYLGFVEDDLEARLERHRKGDGARLMAVVAEAGISWTLARTWESDRSLERKLKRWHGAGQLCPICKQLRSQQNGGKQQTRSTATCPTTEVLDGPA